LASRIYSVALRGGGVCVIINRRGQGCGRSGSVFCRVFKGTALEALERHDVWKKRRKGPDKDSETKVYDISTNIPNDTVLG